MLLSRLPVCTQQPHLQLNEESQQDEGNGSHHLRNEVEQGRVDGRAGGEDGQLGVLVRNHGGLHGREQMHKVQNMSQDKLPLIMRMRNLQGLSDRRHVVQNNNYALMLTLPLHPCKLGQSNAFVTVVQGRS